MAAPTQEMDGLRLQDGDDRDAALRAELKTVQEVNAAIEGVVASLERAKGNMESVARTVASASTLLDTWTRILAQTEQNRRLVLDPAWHGATQDTLDIENEAKQRQQEAERKELELQQRKLALERKAEEEEQRRKAAQGGPSTRARRGILRPSTRASGINRSQSVSTQAGQTSTVRPARGIPTARRTTPAPGRSGIARGRGRVRP